MQISTREGPLHIAPRLPPSPPQRHAKREEHARGVESDTNGRRERRDMRGIYVSGLDRLVEAVDLAEAREARARLLTPPPAGYVCPAPNCGRVFSKRYNQQAHMRLHDGTRPFSCKLCAKAFMWKSSLKSHARMHAKLAATSGPVPTLGKRMRKVTRRASGTSSGSSKSGTDV